MRHHPPVRPFAQPQTGSILLLAVIFTFVIALLVAGTVATTISEAKTTNHALDHTEVMALAEGVTEVAQKEMLVAVANFNTTPMSGTVTLAGESHAYGIQIAGPNILRTDADGVSLTIQPLLIDAQVTRGGISSHVTRVVELTATPIFQYMIFYDDDLEILPGVNMTLGGRVHSNGSIFVGSGQTLSVDTDYFRCTGQILRERKNDGTTTTGTVSIKVHEQTTFEAMTVTMDSTHSDWVNMALDTWDGTVQSGAHGVTEVAAPSIGNIKAFDGSGNPGYYHEHADLVIVDNQAFDGAGTPLTLPPGTLNQVTLYDARESANVTLTEVNIGLLNGSGYFPPNGLIYAYRTDATSSQPNGIRLANAAELAAPLTVVTENPLYLRGNFNTVNKKGAAVMADAVNLLSNAWNNTKTPGSLPAASNTTYNVAMVTGNTPTPDGGGTYSGGFENLPRFHENWSGRTCTIRGSFIKIYESEFADSPWVYGGDRYTAPTRDWQYDPDLNDMANLPPFTPNAIYFRRVTWDDNVPVPFAP